MKNILVTGGAGFIGSHITEYYAKQGHKIKVLDNLSRVKMFRALNFKTISNWEYLKKYPNVELVYGDIRDFESLKKLTKDIDIIFHTAAQTAVTTSVVDPYHDFTNNVSGTFNVLEAGRLSGRNPAIIFCSTNKVYGDNVNHLPLEEDNSRYSLSMKYSSGIPEIFNTDLCEHTPYGCSKLAGDLYMQDYAHIYGLKIGVFRMSCIYGTRQLGVEDQGWVAWFTIASIINQPITIYGDGKQVRDVLFVDDLVHAFDAFIKNERKHLVVNMGGGNKNTLSLLELVEKIENLSGKKINLRFKNWRPSDQKVYISDITKAEKFLHWSPEINPDEGIRRLYEWAVNNVSSIKKVA